MLDSRAAANFVLDQCDLAGIGLSNLQLQKILYFCHVWSLIRLDRPLVRPGFEAWKHGPVVSTLFHQFKRFASNPIIGRAQGLNAALGHYEDVHYEYDTPTSALLRDVVGFYSRVTPSTLIELSHEPEGPWFRAWHHKSAINPGMMIQDWDIVRFYKSREWSVGSH